MSTGSNKLKIHVSLSGGLGNQMFQYAFGLTLAQNFDASLCLDKSHYNYTNAGNITQHEFSLDVFRLSPVYTSSEQLNALQPSLMYKINRRLNRLLGLPIIFGSRIIAENEPHVYQPPVNPPKQDTQFVGYWQNERYFKAHDRLIRDSFEFKSELEGRNKELADLIAGTNAVSLHIRRGDYANNPDTKKTHGLCDLDYYYKAVERIENDIENPVYFVFSDDPEWAIANLTLKGAYHVVDNNSGHNSYIDMQLMSLCKHNIVANSSFSWWGAWLNKNPNKLVLAPQRWYEDEHLNELSEDFVPSGWIRI